MPEIVVEAVYAEYQGAPLKTRAGKPYRRVRADGVYFNTWPLANLDVGSTLTYEGTFGEGQTKWLTGAAVKPPEAKWLTGAAVKSPAETGATSSSGHAAGQIVLTHRDQQIVRQNCQHQGVLLATAAAMVGKPGTKAFNDALALLTEVVRETAYVLESTYVFREVENYPPLETEPEPDAPPEPADEFPAA